MSDPTMALIAAVAAAAAAVFVIVFVILQATLGKTPIQRRLAALRQFSVHRETQSDPLLRRIIVAQGRRVERRPGLLRLAERSAPLLDRLGGKLRPSEWLVIRAIAAVVVAILFGLLLSPLFGLLLGLPAGFLGSNTVLRARIRRREQAFSDELPGALQLMISSLRSGFTLHQSVEAGVRDDDGPVATELRRALSETRISGDFEDALERIGDRMNSAEMIWLVMALRLQKEVGGSLVEVMQTTADTMRERAYLRRHVRSLSGEGRVSAYVLGAMPFLAAGGIWVTQPTYLTPMFHQAIGIIMLAVAITLMAIGAVWLRAVVKVEV
ncbi:type II secretion system F family protein [Actinoplanes sp. HUAS TT8]|uniref:type II secretion system F family protein n=1 Tax=Actinoplanes sp. HUAS TT8 TaxID=3447453 RepID=UPI003F5273DA